MADRRVRFVLAWQRYRVGEVIEPPGTLRQWLITRGYCVPHEAPRPALTLTPPRTSRRSTPHA
jgi:hypothetical protein